MKIKNTVLPTARKGLIYSCIGRKELSGAHIVIPGMIRVKIGPLRRWSRQCDSSTLAPEPLGLNGLNAVSELQVRDRTGSVSLESSSSHDWARPHRHSAAPLQCGTGPPQSNIHQSHSDYARYPTRHREIFCSQPRRYTSDCHIAWHRRRRGACRGASPSAFVLQKRVHVASTASCSTSSVSAHLPSEMTLSYNSVTSGCSR